MPERRARGPQAHWICPRCGHATNPRFDRCAKCNLRRPRPEDLERLKKLP